MNSDDTKVESDSGARSPSMSADDLDGELRRREIFKYAGVAGLAGVVGLSASRPAHASGSTMLDLDLAAAPAAPGSGGGHDHLRLYADASDNRLHGVDTAGFRGVYISRVETKDDLVSAIEALQTAGGGSGGTVLIGEGDFELDDSITITQSTHLVGMGAGRTRLIASTSYSGPLFEVGADFEIDEIGFEDFGDAVVAIDDSGTIGAIALRNCAFESISSTVVTTDTGTSSPPSVAIGLVEVRGCHFLECGTALELVSSGSIRTLITGNVFELIQATAIVVGDDSSAANQDASEGHQITRNVINGDPASAASGSISGIDFTGRNSVISHNVISDISGSGVNVHGVYARCYATTISDNALRNVRGAGIFLATAAATAAFGNTVANNNIFGSLDDSAGIYVVGIRIASDQTTVEGNHIEHVLHGVYLYDRVTELNVLNNQILEIRDSGIWFRSTCDQSTVRGNSIAVPFTLPDPPEPEPKSTPRRAVYIGIVSEPTLENLVIENNVFYATTVNDGIGVYVSATNGLDGARIRGNVMRDLERGVALYSTSGGYANFLIEGNQLGATTPIWKPERLTTSTVRFNEHWVTENSGEATVTDGNSQVTVSHGLSVAPLREDLTLTPLNDLGQASQFWIADSAPTSTSFVIHVDSDPGTSGAKFAWRARTGRDEVT